MPSLLDIRRRVRAVKSTQQITKAMKMVAASRLRRAQERIQHARPFAVQMRRVLSSLSPRERRVLELRYGLDGEHPRTLDEVGRTFNVTRERIRQIENQSLKKLRALAEAQSLKNVAA